MATTAKDIKQKHKQLQDIRVARESTWEDIIDFVLPGLESIYLLSQEERGKRIGTRRYDGTGVSALQLFADGLFGYLISPSIAWLQLVMKEDLMQIPEIRSWLQAVEEHFYMVFNQTNFYDSMSTLFEYTPALGFGDIYSEENLKEQKIVFSVFHPGGIYVEENQFGIVDTVFRDLKISAQNAVQKFGTDRVSKDLSMQTTTENGNPFKEYEFIHAVFPRNEANKVDIRAENKPFASVWVQKEGDPEDPNGRIVKESGFDLNPHNVWRYKKGTTAYGFGPGEDALMEIMGANEIKKSLLKAAQKSVEPALNVPSEMQGMVDNGPNGMNYFTKPDRVISAVRTGVDFPVGIDREERIQRAIERHFKVEYFTLLSNLAAQAGVSRTATEVIEMAGEKAAVLGRPINRLNNEVLNPIIDRIFGIELKAGRLPPMPQVLKDMEGEAIEVNYRGPLAQAQKKAFQVQGISQAIAQIAPLAQIKPEILDIINGDATVREILEATGFPQKAINDNTKVENIRTARAKVLAEEEQKEGLERLAATSKTFAEAEQVSAG